MLVNYTFTTFLMLISSCLEILMGWNYCFENRCKVRKKTLPVEFLFKWNSKPRPLTQVSQKKLFYKNFFRDAFFVTPRVNYFQLLHEEWQITKCSLYVRVNLIWDLIFLILPVNIGEIEILSTMENIFEFHISVRFFFGNPHSITFILKFAWTNLKLVVLLLFHTVL